MKKSDILIAVMDIGRITGHVVFYEELWKSEISLSEIVKIAIVDIFVYELDPSNYEILRSYQKELNKKGQVTFTD